MIGDEQASVYLYTTLPKVFVHLNISHLNSTKCAYY